MREWNIKPGEILAFTLAADARLGPTDYCNDQIWELVLGESTLPALTIQSTLGLRARSLRLFPRFWENDQELINPDTFSNPPVITQLFPNFLAIKYSPFPNIDVITEYWVPLSDGLAGRISIKNNGPRHRLIRFDWIGQLTPTTGQRMAITEVDATQVLWGETGELHSIVYLTGGAEPGSGSYPALSRTLELPPGADRDFTWFHAACSSRDTSLQVNRGIASRRWEAEKARIELLNAGDLQIFTAEPEWDLIFTLTQNLANGLLVGPGSQLPFPSFVLSRQPDQGYSLRGDGSDYNHLWNGQPAFEAYYLSSLILPGSAPFLQGIVHNFLACQKDNGFIDWKPGIAGQQSQMLATPCIASLAWRIFEHSQDMDFIRNCFNPLTKFIEYWLSSEKDRDGDGLPEWDHPIQLGFEDHPVYSRWHDWSAGLDISTAESPAMGALLYQEIKSLISMGKLLNQAEAIPHLENAQERLQSAMTTMWDPIRAIYNEIDRDAHQSAPAQLLGRFTGSGMLLLNRAFESPVRLLVHIKTSGETVRQGQLYIHGSGLSNQPRIERISGDAFNWRPGRGVMTGERLYTSLDKIEIQNLSPNEELLVFSAGYQSENQTCLLPLWAGIPDQAQASSMVEMTILDSQMFWRPFGIPACTPSKTIDTYQYQINEIKNCDAVHLPWNSLIGQGLVMYGYRNLAAELVARLMAGIATNLRSEGVFRHYYDSNSGQGLGERNILQGFAPLGLFMDTLGVRIVSPKRVILSGFNPFPWPVTVKYRGMTILRHKDHSVVIFPDGQTSHVLDLETQIVSLD